MDGGLEVGNGNTLVAQRREALQQRGGHGRGGVHPLRPGEAAVLAAERKERRQRSCRVAPQQCPGVEIGRERQGVGVLRRRPLREAVFDHFAQRPDRHLRLLPGDVDEHAAERVGGLRPGESRMALRQGLRRLINRHFEAHGIAEMSALEDQPEVQRVPGSRGRGDREHGRRRPAGRDAQFRSLHLPPFYGCGLKVQASGQFLPGKA